MTKTEWLLNVRLPQIAAIAEIEAPQLDITDLLMEIEKKGVLHAHR